jgi:gliding motility-associated protein GldM
MAGGKLTPRQKMINLMYLVFIAMLALNMSKEVLSAFGLMNEQFESSNTDATKNNKDMYDVLALKASEAPAQYGAAKQVADKVKAVSAAFAGYVESLKSDVTKGLEKDKEGKLPYEAMDKGDKIDEQWFEGDGYSKKGKEIIAAIEKYKSDMKAAFGNDQKYRSVVSDLDKKFSTADIKDGEGVKKLYLDYHYKGFPSIASLTKLTAMQNNVKVIEANVYNLALGKAALDATSMNKYKAIVVTDKSAFFSGEQVTGKVVLGRYDDATVPTRVSVNGGSVQMISGQANFKIGAGSVGEQDIKGEFVFLEDGKEVKIPIEGNYVVVPKPNSATISADKMNSVYRGVQNPMTISFAGISDNNVSVSAPGLSKGSKPGQYNWNVNGVSGRTATVTVTGKLPDGTSVSDKKIFNIREIPRPAPTLRGLSDKGKGNKNDLSSSTINVEFPDFVFDVRTTVKSFEVYVPGAPAIICQGNKFSDAALKAISKTTRGDKVIVGGIKVDIIGAPGYIVRPSGNFVWEIQ